MEEALIGGAAWVCWAVLVCGVVWEVRAFIQRNKS